MALLIRFIFCLINFPLTKLCNTQRRLERVDVLKDCSFSLVLISCRDFDDEINELIEGKVMTDVGCLQLRTRMLKLSSHRKNFVAYHSFHFFAEDFSCLVVLLGFLK